MGYEINFKCFQWVIGAISDRFLTNQGVPNISVMLLMFSDIRTSLFFFSSPQVYCGAHSRTLIFTETRNEASYLGLNSVLKQVCYSFRQAHSCQILKLRFLGIISIEGYSPLKSMLNSDQRLPCRTQPLNVCAFANGVMT